MIPFIIVKTVKGFAYIRPERVVAINASDADGLPDPHDRRRHDRRLRARRGRRGAARNGGRRGGARRSKLSRSATPMAMSQTEIETMIREAFPDARVEVKDLAGDGNHYAATVVTPAFKGKTPGPPAPDGLRGAEGPDGRGIARAGLDHVGELTRADFPARRRRAIPSAFRRDSKGLRRHFLPLGAERANGPPHAPKIKARLRPRWLLASAAGSIHMISQTLPSGSSTLRLNMKP